MAKTPTPKAEGSADTTLDTEACVSVTSPAGPHWRLGRQFGREPVTFNEDELEAIGKPRGLDAEKALGVLRDDPMLAVVPDRRPKPSAPEPAEPQA